MHYRIEHIDSKTLVGHMLKMSLTNDKNFELWHNFMPKIGQIKYRKDEKIIGLKEYPVKYFENFNPDNEFKRWALVEVSEVSDIPNQMQSFELKAGKYVVFLYKGKPSESKIFFQDIFLTWFPNSVYKVDERPHLEILGNKYKINDSNSEEEIWIPIIEK